MATKQESNQLKLCSSLHEMTLGKKFTDVVLICAEGEKLAAHRAVLAAKSSYFEKMFLSNFKESITKQVDYSHIDKNIMQLILDFIYLHSMENVSELSYSDLLLLYQTSHMFELKELSDYTWDLIITNISAENWLDPLNAVILLGDDSDIRKVLSFILRNLPKIKEREEFLGLSMPQMTNFLRKINEFQFAIKDHLLEAIIKWNEKQEDQKSIQKLLRFINFDFISKEYMDTIIESEKSLFKDEDFEIFFKTQIVPRLKAKTEIEDHFKTLNPKIKFYPKISLQFFFFCCYKKEINGDFLYHKVGLRIFDLETEKVKYIDNLPFHLRDGIVPVQCGFHIYVIGGLSNAIPPLQFASNLTTSFFRYDWETNSVTKLPPLPNVVRKDCHISVVKDDIFVIQNVGVLATNVIYYSVNTSRWVVIKNSLPTVIACEKLKDVLYVICWDSRNTYTLYKLNNSACTRHCSIPVEVKTEGYYNRNGEYTVSKYDNVIYSKMVTFYKDEIFIFKDNDYYFYKFNPEKETWNIGKINFNFGFLMDFRCIAVRNGDLMFYNEMNHKLYKYDEKTAGVIEIKTIRGSLEDDPNLEHLGLSMYETMLVFAK